MSSAQPAVAQPLQEAEQTESPLAPAERIAERTTAVAGAGVIFGALRAVLLNQPLKTPLALSTGTNAGLFGGTFFMAQEAASWARGGRRDVVNSVIGGGLAGAWWSGVFTGGSPRKVVLGGCMYAGLGGIGYFAAGAVGKSIVQVRQLQIGGEAAKQASQEGPSLGKVLEAMPAWFPIRKISAEEIEERTREMERQADEEAAKARQRWAADNPELAAEVQAEVERRDNAH